MAEFVWTISNGGYWDKASNWFDETTGKTATLSPGAADLAIVNGPGLTQFQLVYGPAAANGVEFFGNNALTPGAITNGASFTFGDIFLDPLSAATLTNAVDLEAGVLLGATLLEVNSNLELDGAAAGIGAAVQGLYAGGGEILLLNTAALSAGTWEMNSGELFIDPHSSAAIGAGGGSLGELTVNKNATLSFSGSAIIDNSVIDNGTIATSAPADALALAQVAGIVAGSGQIDISASSALQFHGGVYGISLIRTGAQSDAQFLAGAAGIGSISIGSLATGAFDGNLAGTGTIAVGGGAYLRVNGTVSGFAQVQLAAGATFSTDGGDAKVPISLAGDNKLELDNTGAHTGVNLTGAVSGFNATDLIEHTDHGLYYSDSRIITAANIVNGTLVLSGDGVTIEGITMPGNFSGKQFIVNTAGENRNGSGGFSLLYSDIVLAAGAAKLVTANGAGTVTGASANQFDTLTGAGSFTSLGLTGNTAIDGRFSAGTVIFNAATGNSWDAFDIEAGGSIGAAQATLVSNLELDGGTLHATGTFTLGGGHVSNPNLFVLNGATVQAADLTILGVTSGLNFGPAPEIVIDPTASIEAGGKGHAALGALTVDAGATLKNDAFQTRIYGNVIDNGAIVNGPPADSYNFTSILGIQGTLSGSGVLNIENGTYFNASAINGLSAINIGQLSKLTVYGDMTSGVALTTSLNSQLAVTGTLSGLASLTTGAHSYTHVDGNAAITNAVTVGTLAVAKFGANLHGAGVLLANTGARLEVDGTVAGFSGITMAYGSTLDLFGTDSAVPIDLAGGENLFETGPDSTITAPITNFNSTDLIAIVDSPLPDGGRPITGVTYASGVLTLSYDGAVVNHFTLTGSYAGKVFLTDSTGIYDGDSEISLAGGNTSIAANGTVAGGAGSLFYLLSSGSGANLSFAQNIAVTGTVSGGNVTFEPVTLNGSGTVESLNVTDILAGATIHASGTAAIAGNVELEGQGASLSAGAGILGDFSNNSRLLVLNHGAVRFGSLTLNGLGDFGTGYEVELDPTASLEVGAKGSAAAGSLTVDAGATLTADGTNATIEAPVIDNGLIATAKTAADSVVNLIIGGDTSGAGKITVGSLTSILADGGLSGITGITVATDGSFEASGAAANLGPILAGNTAGVTLDSNATGLSSIAVGVQGSLDIKGNASGTGAITLGNSAAGEIAGTLSGFSGVTVAAKAALTLESADNGVNITLQGNVKNGGSRLVIRATAPVDAVISGFTFGDVIAVPGTADGVFVTEAVYTKAAGNLGKLVLSDDGVVLNTLTLAGNFTGDVFLTNAAGQGDDTNITLTEDAPCYCPGTRIRLADGEVAVEDLKIGDWVMTMHRGAMPVRWIGQRHYDGRFIAGQVLMLPVCIAAGALGGGVPARDLWVSPGHGVYVGGVLAPAWRLVNGSTIRQAAAVESVSYYHVELDSHEVIFAEGCPAESFFDNGCRRQFANAGSAPEGLPGGLCAERVEEGFVLAALARRDVSAAPAGVVGYVDQAGPGCVAGWAVDVARPEAPVCLDILAGGRRVRRVLANVYRADLRRAGHGGGCHGFEVMLPAGFAGEVEVRAAGGVWLARAAAA